MTGNETDIDILKNEIIKLKQKYSTLDENYRALSRKSDADAKTIAKQSKQLDEYYQKFYPNLKYVAVQSAVVFNDKTVAFNLYTESREQNLFRSDSWHRLHINLRGSQIVNMANASPYRTTVAFTKAHLREMDVAYNSDTLIPIDKWLPTRLSDFACKQLEETTVKIKNKLSYVQKEKETEEV